MIQFEMSDIFTAQQLIGNLSVTGPEQAKILVMIDTILKKGVEVKESEKSEKEGNADGSSKQ